MSRLNQVDPIRAEGKAKVLLDAVKAKMGITPNLTKVMATAPAVLEGYLGLSGALAGGTLPVKLKELLAVAVGEVNGCDYCVSAHTAIGKRVGLTAEQLIQGRKGTSEDSKTAAALAFVRTLVAKHGKASDSEVQRVRDAGYSDAEITEIVAHVALNTFTNYVNNVAETEIDFPKAEPIDHHEACGQIQGCDPTR
ncbi:Carboxymuconolactone decarboxylase family protein [Gemmata obscuriglobus]|uniref:Carboxymuconolactone decarboxylase family protein n=1 Tax=Gemmata obscuriglobus TaxID=114 RepID=A0A2Z3GVT4_9BACT|nr:carboxymuconolactone decarboxylase family protein [Gemmata obscuriglobus]AWM37428.1 carboxymuconolactone decarboxylase family protein [Gemmata obscuriglobus]QEG29810.1 Carboxymuconolactone decarboxylase family protein [Gemmata obscuriglobus]VTS09127.1 peroxidase-related enzyme : Alkyl hydroperoxide reductase AhpD OS=Pirellula staleyi (strain ATCC 27377 / DSM 6068 / ICPB 4128) GN=Psta_0275 PE=4 SV=1: CMD [Gemmata obscuriglobus UQM 2246]